VGVLGKGTNGSKERGWLVLVGEKHNKEIQKP